MAGTASCGQRRGALDDSGTDRCRCTGGYQLAIAQLSFDPILTDVNPSNSLPDAAKTFSVPTSRQASKGIGALNRLSRGFR